MAKKEAPIDFFNNRFSIALMEDFGSSTKGAHKKEGFRFGQNNFHLLSPKQQFQSQIFNIQARLLEVTNQLNMTRIFISRIPYRKHYLKLGISPLDYIQYHTDVMVHKIHTILEIMRLLVNDVYDLKISEKKCSWDALCRKLDKQTLPMLYLQQYFKTFENLINARHLSSHQGILNDKAKDKIEVNHMYYMYKFEATHGFDVSEELKRAFPLVYIEFEIKRFKKERVKLIDQILKYNAEILKDFLDSIFPQYQKRVENF